MATCSKNVSALSTQTMFFKPSEELVSGEAHNAPQGSQSRSQPVVNSMEISVKKPARTGSLRPTKAFLDAEDKVTTRRKIHMFWTGIIGPFGHARMPRRRALPVLRIALGPHKEHSSCRCGLLERHIDGPLSSSLCTCHLAFFAVGAAWVPPQPGRRRW